MNILLFKGQFLGPISGADETLVTYATQMKLAGYDVSVLLMYPQTSNDHYYARLRQAGVPVASIAPASARTTLQAGRKVARSLLRAFPFSQPLVRRNAQNVATNIANCYYDACLLYLRRHKPSLVHVMTPDPSAEVMIRASHGAAIPVIYQELGTPYHPPHFEAFYEQFTSVLPLCSEVAALSPLLAGQCRVKLPQSKSLSILPVMTENLLNGGSPVHHKVAQKVTFGFAARLEQLKSPIILIEAFARAYAEYPNIRLQLAGTGSQKSQVIALAKELGIAQHCDFTGVYTHPAEKAAFMHDLDVFVLPSLSEGTPNGIIEAMSQGVAVIATAVGGIPDVVTPETGILVSPNDYPALSQAMVKLARDGELRVRMGQAARLRYKELFSPEAVLPIMRSTYQRLIARNGKPNGKGSLGNNSCAHPWAYHPDNDLIEVMR